MKMLIAIVLLASTAQAQTISDYDAMMNRNQQAMFIDPPQRVEVVRPNAAAAVLFDDTDRETNSMRDYQRSVDSLSALTQQQRTQDAARMDNMYRLNQPKGR